MSPVNREAAQGNSIPSHCACVNPSVGSQSPRVSPQDALSCSRIFAAANAVAKAWMPARFHGAKSGQVRSGRTGETKRGAGSDGSATVIEAGKEWEFPVEGG